MSEPATNGLGIAILVLDADKDAGLPPRVTRAGLECIATRETAVRIGRAGNVRNAFGHAGAEEQHLDLRPRHG